MNNISNVKVHLKTRYIIEKSQKKERIHTKLLQPKLCEFTISWKI